MDAPTIIHKMTINKPRTFQMIQTDMHSYMVASACYEYGLMHYIDYLVLTREKQPSLYSRKQALKGLSDKVKMTDEQIQSMTKGNVFGCWGEDKYL